MHVEEARRRLGEQSEEYRTVLDSHLRQVTASEDNQMERLKREHLSQSSKHKAYIRNAINRFYQCVIDQIFRLCRCGDNSFRPFPGLLLFLRLFPFESVEGGRAGVAALGGAIRLPFRFEFALVSPITSPLLPKLADLLTFTLVIPRRRSTTFTCS